MPKVELNLEDDELKELLLGDGTVPCQGNT